MTATGYEDSREHLRDELRRLDLLLARHLAAWRSERGGPGEHPGLYVSGEQVDRLLADDVPPSADTRERTGARTGNAASSSGHAEHDSSAGATGPADDPGGQRLGGEHAGAAQHSVDDRLRDEAARIQSRVEATDSALRLATLARRFDLDRRATDALLVALGPELDQKYEKVYAYLQDDLARKRPTAGLVLRVVSGSAGGVLDARQLFDPGAPLVGDQLLRCSGSDASLLSQVVEVDSRIASFLTGDDGLAPSLDDVAVRIEPGDDSVEATGGESDSEPKSLASLRLPDATAAALEAARDRLRDPTPAVVHLHGPDGSRRSAAVAATCADLDRTLIEADASRIPGDEADRVLDELRRDARLLDAVLHVHGLPGEDEGSDGDDERDVGAADSPSLGTILAAVDDVGDHVFLSGTDPLQPDRLVGFDAHEPQTVAFEHPDYQLRRAHWDAVELPEGADAAALAGKFRFTPGEIDDAVAGARAQSVDGRLTADALYEACRARSRQRLDELATTLSPTNDLDDIVLPTAQRRQLEAVVAQVEQRRRVYGEWGFDATRRGGNGVNVLFSGPSGTGKTMAAEIVASETGLDCYRVDLATVVSKYVGETEGNLRRIFDEAADSNAILFFDEADALFGERTEVSDAHDRYANVEVNYLLQRMEDHDGVVLLATNLEENVDDAFRRRIDRTVAFPLPDDAAREEIWRSSFPAETPVDDLDWSFLASFELTGGEIHNAALTAAFVAADEGADVSMTHVVRALRRELEKSGRLFSDDDFGDYRERLA